MPDPAGLTGEHTERVLVGEVATRQADPSITVSPRPDDVWRGHCDREIAEHALTAVIDGELAFGSGPQAVVARAAVTDAPDGTRWVGVSAACTIDDQSPTGPAALLYTALLAWGAGRGATRGYTCVPGTATPGWAESLGLRPHHRRRYLRTPASL
ncbi:acetyltransferase, gnat family protein [Mycobacterium ulcerans str. Harvey]|nr:acetyltransferase, gnat family protein [Mycobacterium ulcerans str. Harvey]